MQHCMKDQSSAWRNTNQKCALIPVSLNLSGAGKTITKSPGIQLDRCTVCYVDVVQMYDLS